MRFSDLRPGDGFDGHARVVVSALATAKNGNSFWRFTLADGDGVTLSGVFWDRMYPPPPPRAIVRIRGLARDFQDAISLTLNYCEIDDSLDPSYFQPKLPPARRVAPAALDELIGRIVDPGLRELVEVCFGDGEKQRFCVHPAAMKMHGAVSGGLLAHTVRVTRIALSMAELTVSLVDVDLLIAAALLHDIGKLDELTESAGEEPTEAGRLLGHIVPGVMRITRAAARVPDLPPDRVQDLVHVVIASHGKKEFGSPAVPALLEAVIVHLADETEASIESALGAIEAAPAGNQWTDFIKPLESRLRVPE